MKKLITSAGLAAVGVTSLQAINAPDFTRVQTERPWSVTCTVRAFYDDNFTTSPATIPGPGGIPLKPNNETFGFEVRPSVRVSLPFDQTFIGAGYAFAGRYFDARMPDAWDFTHEFDARLNHRFSERYDLDVTDSFVITQEPTILDAGGIITSPTRTNGDSKRNAANIKFNARLTRLIGLGLGYGNNLYSYDQTGVGSRAAILDRMEQTANIDLRFQVTPQFVGFLGYQYGMSSYNGNSPLYLILIDPTPPGTYAPGPLSNIRDSQSHYGYLGAEYMFSSQLTGAIRAGVQATSYDSFSNDSMSPYVDLSLTYAYKSGCSVTGGFKHTRNATDIVQPNLVNTAQPTLDQETSVIYGSINHQITRNLTGSLISQYQMSTFNAGAANDRSENIWLIGLNFDYRINRHWAVELGYNFDTLSSDLPNRSFDRNRVYTGFRATY